MTIQGYVDPAAESTLQMGLSAESLVLVSQAAHVSSSLANRFDSQRKKGENFEVQKFLGIAPARFTITFIVTPEEEDHFWSKILPLLRQKGSKGAAPPLEIVNPQVNRVGVRKVVMLSSEIDPPSPRDGRSVTLQVEEQRKTAVPNKTKATKEKTPQNLEPGATQINQAP